MFVTYAIVVSQNSDNYRVANNCSRVMDACSAEGATGFNVDNKGFTFAEIIEKKIVKEGKTTFT